MVRDHDFMQYCLFRPFLRCAAGEKLARFIYPCLRHQGSWCGGIARSPAQTSALSDPRELSTDSAETKFLDDVRSQTWLSLLAIQTPKRWDASPLRENRSPSHLASASTAVPPTVNADCESVPSPTAPIIALVGGRITKNTT